MSRRIFIFSILVAFICSTAGTHVLALDATERDAARGSYPWWSLAAPTCGTGAAASLANNKYALPATKGYVGEEENLNENGILPRTGKQSKYGQHAKLGQAYRDYYITMRWTTHKWYWNGDATLVDGEQDDWLAAEARFVLVTNSRTKKSIIATVLESGPAPWTGIDTQENNNPKGGWQQPQLGTPSGYKGRVAGLPPKAMEAIGAIQREGGKDNGDELLYSWAPDKSTPGPTNTDISGQDAAICSGSGGVGVSPDGFTFPLQTTKAKMTNNAYWSPRCKNAVSEMGRLGTVERRTDLCHHDYLAADIQTPAGTKVLAPRPGKIIRSGRDNNLCISHSVSLYSAKALGGDGNTYYLTHLSAQAQADIGDVVQAGAVIGTVDAGHGCFQSHLHIDASDIQTGFSRGGNCDNICGTAGPLLDPQPALIGAYNNLP